MRSSILLTSVLALGAIAGPIDKRVLKSVQKVVATVEVDIHVRVGQDGKPYTTQTVATHLVDGRHGDATVAHAKPTTSCAQSTSTTRRPRPTQKPRPPPAPKTTSARPRPAPVTTYRPAPTSTSKPYKPVPAPTTSKVYVPAPAPTTSKVYVPPPQPSTTTKAPAPSTQAPAPSSAPQYGVNHKSGELQATLSSGVDYQNAMLWHHNRARANHGASNLEWSDDCVAGAQKAADTCVFAHVITEGQGQNLYATSGDAYNATAAVTEAFYKAEADLYSFWGQEPPHDPANPGALDEEIFHAWGHLTQVVWKETTHVGCVTVNCPGMDTNRYTICNYFPAGNMATKFAENVVAPRASYNEYAWLD